MNNTPQTEDWKRMSKELEELNKQIGVLQCAAKNNCPIHQYAFPPNCNNNVVKTEHASSDNLISLVSRLAKNFRGLKRNKK